MFYVILRGRATKKSVSTRIRAVASSSTIGKPLSKPVSSVHYSISYQRNNNVPSIWKGTFLLKNKLKQQKIDE